VITAYTKPVRFSKLLRDIRCESRVTKLSSDVKFALQAVINARAGTRMSARMRCNWTDAEVQRIDTELDRLGVPLLGGKL
jgi:hypothetical protein